MKALCVKQPWAELIRQGIKPYEMRTWVTKYRGPLLICASKLRADSPDADHWEDVEGPTGCAICLVDLVDVRPVNERTDSSLACCTVGPGQFVWELRNVKPTRPVPVRGSLGIFEVNLSKKELFR